MARVSLKDIARECEVSESLVSKVLSGRMGNSTANAEVVQNIRSTARRLGYRRNRTASNLASGRHGTIGVFVHRHGEAGSNIVEDFMEGVTRSAGKVRQRLWLQFFHLRSEFLASAGDISTAEMDGLIVSGVPHQEMVDDFKAWQAEGMPIITTHSEILDPTIVNVGCLEGDVARVATQHLIDRGSKQIVAFDTMSTRTGAIRQAQEAAGQFCGDDYLLPVVGFTYEAARRVFSEFLDRDIPFDGVVGQSDHQALAAMHLLHERGIRVPDQVRVIGIDNSGICSLSPITLSSVSQQFSQRGELAVEMLLQMIEGRKVTSRVLDPIVHHRQSS